ncbi:MAG: hypothetical protein LLF76_00510 [Planctomycetaceae bacterium]|nr:hypothetical protein [Planctomycetaceae bacterium]
MAINHKLKLIGQELLEHSPFTLFGAVTGILFMLAGIKWFHEQAQAMFAVFHPLHVMLSAVVTAALFKLHRKAANFVIILVIGVTGAIGVATLSDCILPFFGETVLGAAIPTESAVHGHARAQAVAAQAGEAADEHRHEGRPDLHLGFIEEWYLVFPAAILGVVLAYLYPTTYVPHAGHILLSTWASAAHMLMNTHAEMSLLLVVGMFIALFIAVWLPCCFSDIVFPLLFIRQDGVHVGHTCLLCGKKSEALDE